MADGQFESIYTTQRFIDMFNDYARGQNPIFAIDTTVAFDAFNPSKNLHQRESVPTGELFGLVGVKRSDDGKDLMIVLKWSNPRKIGLLFTLNSTQFYAYFRQGVRFVDEFITNVFTKERAAQLVAQQVELDMEELTRQEREEAERRQRASLGYGGW